MTLSTSEVATCCSRASLNSLLRLSSCSRRSADEWPRRARTCVLSRFALVVLRRRVFTVLRLAVAMPPHPNWGGRRTNTLPHHSAALCVTAKSGARCPLWVKSGHRTRSAPCPLYPQKRTSELSRGMSALCQKRTSAFRTDERRYAHREATISALASPNKGDVMHFANYLVLGLLIACMLGAAAVVLSRRNS